MIVIPAVDLRGGKCVRLVEGMADRETVYSENPVEMALLWESQGARWLHVVDLDGAFSGRLKNLDIIKEIIVKVNIPVEVGGGIREMGTIEELLEIGARRVILGTIAIIEPDLVAGACTKYDDAIMVSIDAKDGKVAIEGWGVTAEKDALELAGEMKRIGVRRLVFTDIRRDGTLKGPNLQAIEEVARTTGLNLIAAGGISVIDDVQALLKIEHVGIEAVIIGKALYAGSITLKEALAVTKEEKKACVC